MPKGIKWVPPLPIHDTLKKGDGLPLPYQPRRNVKEGNQIFKAQYRICFHQWDCFQLNHFRIRDLLHSPILRVWGENIVRYTLADWNAMNETVRLHANTDCCTTSHLILAYFFLLSCLEETMMMTKKNAPRHTGVKWRVVWLCGRIRRKRVSHPKRYCSHCVRNAFQLRLHLLFDAITCCTWMWRAHCEYDIKCIERYKTHINAIIR